MGAWAALGILRRFPLMLLLLVGPSAVVVLFALGTGLDVYPRFFLTLMIGFFVVLAELGIRYGRALGGERLSARHPLLAGWPLLLVVGLFVLMLPRVLGTPKQPYEQAIAWAWAESRSASASTGGPVVYCVGHAAPGCEFYAPRLGLPLDAAVARPTALEMQTARADRRRDVTAVTTLQRIGVRRWPDHFEELEAHWLPAQRFPGTIGDGDVVVWRPRAAVKEDVGAYASAARP